MQVMSSLTATTPLPSQSLGHGSPVGVGVGGVIVPVGVMVNVGVIVAVLVDVRVAVGVRVDVAVTVVRLGRGSVCRA